MNTIPILILFSESGEGYLLSYCKISYSKGYTITALHNPYHESVLNNAIFPSFIKSILGVKEQEKCLFQCYMPFLLQSSYLKETQDIALLFQKQPKNGNLPTKWQCLEQE